MPPRLVISHCHSDTTLIRLFKDYLIEGLGVAGEDIYCTIESSQIRPGEDYVASILQSIQQSVMVILLITPAYLRSPWCLCEMGAAWAVRPAVSPVLIAPLKAGDIDNTPFTKRQALPIRHAEDLKPLAVEVSRLGLAGCATTRRQECTENLLAHIDALARYRQYVGGDGFNGIVALSRNRQTDQKWWDDFYSSELQPSEVIMMGQSMARAFTPHLCNTFLKWCRNGTRMRVLYLAPDAPSSSQIHQVGQEIDYESAGQRQLSAKVLDSYDNLKRNLLRKLPDAANIPAVRFATRDLPFSMMAVDNRMLVTMYGTRAEADECLTFEIADGNCAAFRGFMDEFLALWTEHSRVYPHEDPLLSYLRNNWGQLVPLRDREKRPAVPRQAIIFPTHRCSVACSYCMYRDVRNGEAEIEPVDFERILNELLAAGTRHIELSGGGEPTEHRQFGALLEIVRSARTRFPDAEFGLLTNGRELGQFDAGDLIHTFNEYIRISRFEGSAKDSETWRNGVKRLVDAKLQATDAQCRVSVKYLLTPNGLDTFVEMLGDDLRDHRLRNIDYLRITSDRRVDSEIIPVIEQQIWHTLTSEAEFDCEHKLSMTLTHVRYPRNFKCWVSPVSVVIDPHCVVYLCCNYYNDEGGKRIGTLADKTFLGVWNSDRHFNLRQRLSSRSCSRDYYCNCRYAELQTFIDHVCAASGETL